MIDELDLAFDEQIERGKPRHRRGGRGAKGGKGKSTVAFLMVFILLGVLGVGGYLGFEKVKGFFTAADYGGAGTGQVEVSLGEGSLTEIGNTLVEADVVKSTAAFIEAAEENPRGKNIQPGTYKLRKQMSAKDAVTVLLDPKARITKGITIPEGLSTMDIYTLLSKKTKIPVKDFEAAAKDPKALG
ncbi:endolytic transglycosylase MltG, partial [Couchioplanes caeruleus]|uniref:endolytic transglycosylase MltG n=1 Tax=Couchioplanes caeruleus TaxID=56438 RepID=UPI0011604350